MSQNISDVKLLLAYQASAIALSAQHQLLVIEKSRRTGITYGFAADAVLTAAPAFRPQNVYYIAYNLDMTREFIGYVGEFAKAFDEAATTASEFLFDDGSEAGIKALRVDFPSGKAVIALSSKPRSLRGMQGKVLIDEAAFHDDLDELLKAAMALTMWGSHVVVISTHDGTDNPFNLLIEDIREGKKEGHVMRLTLAEALADGLYKRICLRNSEEWSPEKERAWEASLRKRYGDAAEEELDVIPSRGSGVYLSRATIMAAMSADLPVIRLACPDGFEQQTDEYRQDFGREFLEEEVAPWLRDFDPLRRSFFGQDFARTGDVSPIAVGQLDPHLNLICRFILEMRNVPFREQEFILNWIVSRIPNFCAGTLSYEAGDLDLSMVEPYQGRLIFGPERFEAIQSDWHETVVETPPAASFAELDDDGHDDADGIVDRMIAEDGYRVANAMTGNIVDRLLAADSETEARAILAGALAAMDDQPLIQALERAGFAVQLDAATQPATEREGVA